MPRVSRLSITPVKGLGLLHPDEVDLERFGVVGNRRFYLIAPGGRLFSGVDHGPLVRIQPRYDAARDFLSLTFPDGSIVEDEVAVGELVATDFWGRTVSGRVVAGAWAEALSAYAGKDVRLVKTEEPGDGSDVHAVTLLSEESVAELARRAGRDAVDGRRFRMLVDLVGCAPHEEDTWAGREMRLGEALVRILGPVPRCATTTRDPSSGIRDLDTLRVIKDYRGLRSDRHLDFGVYADVLEPGRVRVGDPVGSGLEIADRDFKT